MRKKLLSIIPAFMAACMLWAASPMDAEAAQKDQTVEISTKVGEAVFKFTFDKEQYYMITITDPDGEVTSKENWELETEISIVSPKIGTYQIGISAEEDFTSTSTMTTSALDYTDAESSNITITSEIVGLTLRFVDGQLVGSWDDTGLGTINVKVTNPKNLQEIYSESIKESTFTADISSDIDEIEVYLVAASSAKIDGSGVRYTMQVIRDLKGSVDFNGKPITNETTTNAHITLEEPRTVYIERDGKEVYREELEAGEYDAEVPLDGTENTFKAYVADESGNENTFDGYVVRDVTYPAFSMSGTIADGMTTTDSVITVSGTVTEVDVVDLNGITVEVGDGSRFTYDYPLDLIGENKITLSAEDEAGNVATVDLTIIREEKQDYTPYIIGGAFVALVLIIIVLVVKLRSGYEYVDEDEEDEDEDGESDDSEDDEDDAEDEDDEEEDREPTKRELKKQKKQEEKERKEQEKEQKKQAKIDAKQAKKDEKERMKAAKEASKAELAARIPTPKERLDALQRKNGRWKTIFGFASMGVLVLICLVLFRVCLLITVVGSGSMEPTIQTGSFVIFNRLRYVTKNVERGDIIAFWSDDGNSSDEESKVYLKRVVGIAGDEIEFHDGVMYLNGMQCEESYIPDGVQTTCDKTFIVPNGCVFVLGDNRENSMDSRYWGDPYVNLEDIIGKYLGGVEIPF